MAKTFIVSLRVLRGLESYMFTSENYLIKVPSPFEGRRSEPVLNLIQE
jgi:hypothetical protein